MDVMEANAIREVETIHTLGPQGTNLEAAARFWLTKHGKSGERVVLYDSLETAIKKVTNPKSALLACVVYPYLHHLVFQNVRDFTMADCFVMDTLDMVLAARDPKTKIHRITSHPAPVDLVAGRSLEINLANSNADAAARCAAGEYDGCITTIVAARKHQLAVLENFGPIAMGFSLHVLKSRTQN